MWGVPGRGPLPPSIAPQPGEWQQCGGAGAVRGGAAQPNNGPIAARPWHGCPRGRTREGAKCQSSHWAWLCSPWALGRRRGREPARHHRPVWGHRYPTSPGRRGCGRMPGREDALAAGCLGMAAVGDAPEPPGAMQGLAPSGTVGMPGFGRDWRVTQAGWAGAQAAGCALLQCSSSSRRTWGGRACST